jgi:hypothetical protein
MVLVPTEGCFPWVFIHDVDFPGSGAAFRIPNE